MKILRILNTLFLAGILATLILILLHLRQPIKVDEPVAIQGWSPFASIYGAKPIPVTIEEQPVQVEITQ